MANGKQTALTTASPESIDMDAHEAEKEKRYQEHLGKRNKLLRCLDPEEAKIFEQQKPIFEWSISVDLMERKERGGGLEKKHYELQVVAQNADDAWAMFCDRIGKHPSRRDCLPEIKKLKRRTADD